MTKEILKTVFAGILAGVALFMVPFFIIKLIIFFLLIKAIFRLLGGRSRWHGMRAAWAYKYKNMSEDERKVFMEKYGRGCHGWHNSCSPENNVEKTNNV